MYNLIKKLIGKVIKLCMELFDGVREKGYVFVLVGVKYWME